jgi:hypothetical protein
MIKESAESLLALVQGGRAKNERPTDILVEGVIADADYESFYVTILQLLNYPIGLPITWGKHESDKKVRTLGEVLQKEGQDFEKRMYFILISTNLTYNQTLIPSKIIESIKVNEKYSEDDPKIPADFRLYTQQIINGVVTSDILEAYRNVASAKEWSEFMNAEVSAFMYYPSSMKCTTPEEWYEKTKEHAEKTGNAKETKIVRGKPITVDNRSRYWLAVPIEDFLSPYAKERKEIKEQMNLVNKGTEEYSSLDAQQKMMKLVGNTLYGDMASPYFVVGNVLVANVITAAARTGIWCAQTALGGYESITDGTQHNINTARFWKDKKPGMNTLSLWRNPDKLSRDVRRGLYIKPLASETNWEIKPGKVEGGDYYTIITNGVEYIESKAEGWTFFDKAVKQHTLDFFRTSEEGREITILPELKVLHKDIYCKAIFHSQTNYKFTHIHGAEVLRARGHKIGISNRNGGEDFQCQTPYNDGTEVSNIVNLFNDLEKNPNNIQPYRPQTISSVLKCNQANQMLNTETDNPVKQNNLLAGDSINKRSWVRPISTLPFHWQTHKQYESWNKAVEKLKSETGWGLEQFFLNEDGTLDYEKALNDIQRAIDEGKMWINPTGSKGRGKNKGQSHHPYMPTDEIELVNEEQEY